MSKVFYSHREHLYSKQSKKSFGCSFTQKAKICSSDHSHLQSLGCSLTLKEKGERTIAGPHLPTKNNATIEFGCSLTLEAEKHSSDYSQKFPQNYSRTRWYSEWVLSYMTPRLSMHKLRE